MSVAPEMRCRHCGWSGQPDTDEVEGVPVYVCPACEWARGLQPVDRAETGRRPIDLAKQAYAAGGRAEA